MSDDYADLEARASEDTPAPPVPDNYSDLEARAKESESPSPEPPEEVTPTSVVAAKLLEGATALPAKVIGGYRGLWDLLTGKGSEQATRDIEATGIHPHYERINMPEARTAETAMNHPANPINWPSDILGAAKSGMETSGMSPNVSGPLTEAIGYTAPLLAGLGARGAAEAPSVPRASQDLRTRLAPQYAGQSMGAAGATPNLLNATPELRTKVQAVLDSGQQLSDAGKTALQRHVEAESLPIPAHLTRGQALGDEAIKSDEFNSRAKSPEISSITSRY
jgi:hypothetical protein